MKVLEILTEAISFGTMQKKIYEYVFSKMKTDKDTLAAIKDEAENDRFWTSSFDEVLHAIERDYSIDSLIDALCQAIIDVKEKIEDHYGNAMNHAPGYKKPKITFSNLEDFDSIPEKDLNKLVSELAPGVLEKAQKERADREAKAKAAKKAEIKSITKERLEEVAAYVKKWSAAGWKDFASVIKKQKWVAENFSSDYGVTVDELKKMDGEAVKKVVHAKNEKTPEYNVYSEWENISELRHGASKNVLMDELAVLQNFQIIATNKPLAKKLWAMIA